MAVLLQVRDVQIAFGIEWRLLTGLDQQKRPKKPSKEISGYAGDIPGGATFGLKVRHADKGQTVVGLLPNKAFAPGAAPKKKVKIYAAAQIFAAAITEANAGLIIVMEGGQYGFIGIRNHVPAVGYDAVGNAADIERVANQFIGRVKGTGVSFYFVGKPGPELDVTRYQPNDSLPNLFKEKFERPDALLAPIKEHSLTLPLSVAIGVILLGGYLYQLQQDKDQEEAQAKSTKLAPAPKPKDPSAEYAHSVQAAFGTGIVPAAPVSRIYMDALGPLPTVATLGWQFNSAECGNGACEIKWEREARSRATYEAISAARGSTVRLLADLKFASETIQVVEPKPDTPDTGSFPPTQEFLLKTGSRFQVMERAGLTATISSKTGGKTFDLVGDWPNGTPPPGAKLIRTGTWEISGNYALRSALLELPANMTITSFSLSLKKGGNTPQGVPQLAGDQADVQFTAKGNFYVR